MNTPQSPAMVEVDRLPALPKHVGTTVRGKTRNAKWTHTMLNDSLNFPGGEKLYTADQMRAYATEAIAAERAEVVRLRGIVEKLLSACDQAGSYVGGEAPDHEADEWFANVEANRAALATTTQGEQKS